MGNKSKFFTYGIFVLLVGVLSIYFVLAAIVAPTPVLFELNTTAHYDDSGNFTINWTSGAGDVEINYTIYLMNSTGTVFNMSWNDSLTGYRFENQTDANYTFIVQAMNKTMGGLVVTKANSSTVWMIVDTTLPEIQYDLTGSEMQNSTTNVSQSWVHVNVTNLADINNHTITFELYNGSGRWNITHYTGITTSPRGINWTGLADGDYTYNVSFNDSARNVNTTTLQTITLDTTDPTAIPSCSPSEVETGQAFPCTCSGSDATSGIISTSASSNSPDGTSTPSSTGAFVYTCSVQDYAGNSASSTTTYTVKGSGGGGGSSGASSQKISSWTTITPGAVTIMKDFNFDIGVKEIKIEVKNEVQNVLVTVIKYSAKPAEVSVEKSGKVHQYIQINAENLEDELEKATVQFRAEKTWMVSNSLAKEDIGVFKFDETAESWEALITTYAEEDDTFYYYDVELDSFSYFVMGEAAAVIGEGDAGAVAGEEGKNLTWLWVLIGLIVLVAIGWSVGKKKN